MFDAQIFLLCLAVFDSDTDTNLVKSMRCWGFFVVAVDAVLMCHRVTFEKLLLTCS